MALLLNIDTAGENAVITISKGEKILVAVANKKQKEHASFLHNAVKDLLLEIDITIKDLDAVAVVSGPGSYTGLRVGMASAKGFCYALQIPLITIPTLELMATFAVNKINDKESFYCPMIDARRMEVFTAVYTYDLVETIKPTALLLEENSFEALLKEKRVYFSGNGAFKLNNLIKNNKAFFIDEEHCAETTAMLANKYYERNNFSDVAYASPFYLKEFYTPVKP